MHTGPRSPGSAAALRQGLRALLLRKPRADLRFDAGTVFLLLLPMLLLDMAFGWVSVAGQFGGWNWQAVDMLPRRFTAEGAISTLAGFGTLLLAAWLAVRVLGRPLALWSLAAPLGVAWIAFSLLTGVLTFVVAFTSDDAWSLWLVLRPLFALAWLLVVWRLLAGFARSSGRRRRALAALLVAGLMAGGMWLYGWPDYWEPDHAELAQMRREREAAPPAPPIDHEAVMYTQTALLATTLAQLAAGQPGRTDFYAVGFAGDGSEPVFANEVRHFAALASTRYGADGRTVALLNDPATATSAPIATRTALESALQAIGERMDVDEDVLLLFLTTHGSEDHRLLVQLGELPLDQITPERLDAALDASGVRWRIVIISACYAGGYVEPLADANSIVIAAARADRTSFGCGVTSELTYFGEAFLVDGLNQERNPVKAFALASARIEERERTEELPASEPQIHVGSEIAARLPGWIEALPEAPPVPFQPHAD